MLHDGSMAAVVLRRTPTVADVMAAAGRLRSAREEMRELAAEAEGPVLGEVLIQIREAGIDPLEAVFADGLRRFDAAGEYAEDGALRMVDWLRWKCKMSAGAAAERLTVARQIEQLPKTEDAFARGEVSYQQVAVLARTADHVGAEQVRKVESSFLKAAETMDPGQLVGVAKDFEHRVDPQAALDEANRAFERRYLHIGEPVDGLVRLDGLIDSEAGAALRQAVDGQGAPSKDDDRTPGQRRADRLMELVLRSGRGKGTDGASSRPHLIIRASVETLMKSPGAPAGELEHGGTVPADTVRRVACDAAITRIVGAGELEGEISKASRTIQPATRRALDARDRHCVFGSCDRPPVWCDGHHIWFWAEGGPTTLENLALLCRPHHRKVHEGGWRIQRRKDGRFVTIPTEVRSRGKPPP
jgi:hypothetical protein